MLDGLRYRGAICLSIKGKVSFMEKAKLSILSVLFISFVFFSCEQSTDPTTKSADSTEMYAIGDVYPKTGSPEGIVFYVDSSCSHGKIVSLDQEKCLWAELYSEACNVSKISQMCSQLSSSDGSLNYDIFCSIVSNAEGNSDYGAFFWCENIKGGNWYIPAKNELVLMINNADKINETLTTLRNKGYTAPAYSTNMTWSSTVRGQVSNSNFVQFSIYITGSASMICNEDKYYARAVKTF